MDHFDIFISYKKKNSFSEAMLLYKELTDRGYSVFFDKEEMRRSDFDVQIQSHLENARDVIVILKRGSLSSCRKGEEWQQDWFCKEICLALEKKKNIIPLRWDNSPMPRKADLPEELKGFAVKHSPDFLPSMMNHYLDDLVANNFLESKPSITESKLHLTGNGASAFKILSNRDADIYLDGILLGRVAGVSGEPLRLTVPKKGSFVIKGVEVETGVAKIDTYKIGLGEEKVINLMWDTVPRKEHFSSKESQNKKTTLSAAPEESKKKGQVVSVPAAEDGDIVGFDVPVGNLTFKMIRVDGGRLMIGATPEQGSESSDNDLPPHDVDIPTFYIGQLPVTEDLWKEVMGDEGLFKIFTKNTALGTAGAGAAVLAASGAVLAAPFVLPAAIVGGAGAGAGTLAKYVFGRKRYSLPKPYGKATYGDAVEFVHRLSAMTKLQFCLPTEEEWEYAARGGRKSKGYRFAGSDDIRQVAWYLSNSFAGLHPVGQKEPNELGLFDMCGNVFEWTESKRPGSSEFIRRGGSYLSPESWCRVASRRDEDFFLEFSNVIGLRVVLREIPENLQKALRD